MAAVKEITITCAFEGVLKIAHSWMSAGGVRRRVALRCCGLIKKDKVKRNRLEHDLNWSIEPHQRDDYRARCKRALVLFRDQSKNAAI